MKPLFFLLTVVIILNAQVKQGSAWMAYKNVSESGFSQSDLNSIESKLKTMQTSSFMIISEGRIAYSYGDVTRRFRNASIRKSLMHLLLGLEYDKGNLDVNASLSELKIDDVQSLSDKEKSKTLHHLMSSNSKIFHPSAHMPRNMKKNLPERHSDHDEWFYNNWDYNALATVYKNASGSDTFTGFEQHIAKPLQLEDFDLSTTYYRYELDVSVHPAYLFRLSARDLARIGQLYLNSGMWNGKRIVSEKWIKLGFTPQVNDLGRLSMRGKYGYLWWLQKHNTFGPIYYASGNGGQRLYIIPKKKMVIVHMVNTYENRNQTNREIITVLFQALQAKSKNAKPNPELVAFNPDRVQLKNNISLSREDKLKYVGSYKHRALGLFHVRLKDETLYLESNVGIFEIFADQKDIFIAEDLLTPAHFKAADSPDQKGTIRPKFTQDRRLDHVIFYY